VVEAGTIACVTTEWQRDVLDPIESLIGTWEKRGERDAVATLVPAWRANAGLTDGWHDVLATMRAVPSRIALPDEELATLSRVADRIEIALGDRQVPFASIRSLRTGQSTLYIADAVV
jgi:hypothetical protein